MEVSVYLAGEIHSDWRDQLAKGVADAELPVTFLAPVTDHPASDDVGVNILGAEDRQFWKDHKGGKINAIRTRTMIDRADIVIVRFGDKYKQWNAAFDAGFAAALGKPRTERAATSPGPDTPPGAVVDSHFLTSLHTSTGGLRWVEAGHLEMTKTSSCSLTRCVT